MTASSSSKSSKVVRFILDSERGDGETCDPMGRMTLEEDEASASSTSTLSLRLERRQPQCQSATPTNNNDNKANNKRERVALSFFLARTAVRLQPTRSSVVPSYENDEAPEPPGIWPTAVTTSAPVAATTGGFASAACFWWRELEKYRHG